MRNNGKFSFFKYSGSTKITVQSLCMGMMCFTLYLSSIAGASPSSHSNIIDIVIVMGQSNALGYPNDGDYYTNSMPTNLKANQADILSWNWTYSKWSNEPLHPVSWRFWGLELSYLNSIYESQNTKMALIKCAYGSTLCATHWQKTDTTTVPDMYARSVSFFNEAISTLKTSGYIPMVRQMVWVQGENDSVTEGTATNYYENFNIFWNDFCGDTGISKDTSIILAPLSPLYNANYAAQVKEEQAQLIFEFSNIDELDVSDAEWYSGVHYSGAYLITMGERCASNYLSKFAASLEFCNIPDFSETPYSLNWFGSSNQIYRIESSTNLIAGFEFIDEHIQGIEGTNSFVVEDPISADQNFYRIKLEDTLD